MSFGGHIADMVNRIEQNRRLLKATRDRMREVRDAYREAGVIRYKSGKPFHKKITEEDRRKIRKEIIRMRRKERRKEVIVLFISIIITGIIFYLLFYLFFNSH